MGTLFRHIRLLAVVNLVTLLAAGTAGADVTRLEIVSRAPVGNSGYERIVGIAHFAIDPKAPRNAVIADIDRAPVNKAGLVEFSSDVFIMRPLDAARSNGIALVDVPNRGRRTVLSRFNRDASNDPVTDADLGDAYLMSQGYTIVAIGWEFDIRRDAPAAAGEDGERGVGMGITIPAAENVAAVIRATFIPNDADPQRVGDLAGYRPLDDLATDTTLTVRDGQFDRPEPISRDRFTVSGNTVTLQGGFAKGRIYEISYRPKTWPVSGLGLAAYRDMTAWVKYSPDAIVRVPRTIAFGSSQSGRFLRTFLYYGFNADERGRQVLDGAMIHIAGAARLSLNERGAQPTALSMYTATQFPFATSAERDPLTGRTEGLLDNPRARDHQPKLFLTNTAVEYWGGGRSAALVHTSPDGKRDLTLPTNVRAYFLTGTQHGPARFPTKVGQGQQPDNPLEYWWTLRALLVSMTKWVQNDAPPPPSQVPHLADGTLVPVSAVKFPSIAGVQAPGIVSAARYEGKEIPFLVPQVDADGNEMAGIRTAEQRVPVATYTGWNFRNPSIGGTRQLVSLLGSAIPFARTAADRHASGDPRPSIAERYSSYEDYLRRARQATDALVKSGFLLPADVAGAMVRIDEQWRQVH
jgi:hypothetical protein